MNKRKHTKRVRYANENSKEKNVPGKTRRIAINSEAKNLNCMKLNEIIFIMNELIVYHNIGCI